MKKIILAPIFTDHMVLQRNKPLPFWGKVKPSDTVTLTFAEVTATAQADEKGSWTLTLPPMKAATGLTLTVSDSVSKRELTDIAIGEVWLAGGQSNMEFSLEQSTEWARYQDPANRDRNVRFFYTPKLPYRNEAYYEAFDQAGWNLVDSEGFKDWSSVGYQFAEHLSAKLGVTIGIIGCNWGGTSASAWMSREYVEMYDDTKIYMQEYDERIAGIPLEDQYAAYDQYEREYNEWNRKCGELYAENPSIDWDEVNRILGTCQWPGPVNAGNPFRPCGLYDQMLMEICPYALAGFLFYQGESDDHRPQAYYHLFGSMIANWRASWKDNELPFLITQLPMHRYSGSPDFKNWPIIREAQLRIYEEVKDTGLAVIPDCGEWSDIHPKSKATVAKRLALQALYQVYGIIWASEANAPLYDYKVTRGNALEIHFKQVYDNGLRFDGEAKGYEVAGADKVFHDATPTLTGKDTITLTSSEVEKPLYARYLWYNYCLPSLWSGNGMPASPFRTDLDDGSDAFTGFDDIQQIMET